MSEILNLTTENYASATESGATVVDFYADWCGPCKMFAPLFEEAAKDYEGRIAFARLNVDEAREIALKNKVLGVPTLLFFKDGEIKDRVTGVIDRSVLDAKLGALL